MRGQHTQHSFLLNTVQSGDTERIKARFSPYPGYWNHLRKSPLRLLSVLRFNIKSLAIRGQDHSTHSINYMNKSVESVENCNRLNIHPTGFH
jgi:hypothetical protein